jgi:hypothetical protein
MSEHINSLEKNNSTKDKKQMLKIDIPEGIKKGTEKNFKENRNFS